MHWILITFYYLALTSSSLVLKTQTNRRVMWLFILLGSAIGPLIIDFLLIALGQYDGVKDPFYYIGYGILALLFFATTVVSIFLWDKFDRRYIARV